MAFSCIFLRSGPCDLYVFRNCLMLCRFFAGTPLIPDAGFILSDENRASFLRKLNTFKPISPRAQPPASDKSAAVLVPLCIVQGETSLLYTLRKADLRRHRGQVSFPGGVRDSDDPDLVTTALREAHEELGISPTDVQVWGAGAPILGVEFSVLPVVGYIGHVRLGQLRPCPGEVEQPFSVPLSHFCKPENCRYTQFRIGDHKGYTLPTYLNAPHRIWGITALITHLVLKCLLPDHYHHSIKYIKSVRYRDPVL